MKVEWESWVRNRARESESVERKWSEKVKQEVNKESRGSWMKKWKEQMEWENWESGARKHESIVRKWSVEVEREYEKEDREIKEE